MPRACGDADASRLSDHAGTGARTVSLAARRVRRRSKSKPNSAAVCPTTFTSQLQDEIVPVVRGRSLEAMPHIRRGAGRDHAAGLRRIERTAGEHAAPASIASACTTGSRRTFSRPSQVAPRQAGARSVSVCRRADADVAPERCLVIEDSVRRHHRRRRRRDARARLSRRQPLPPRPRRRPARSRGRCNIRRYAAIAGVD